MGSLTFLSITICVLVSCSKAQEFTITPITTSAGLYYEKIGDVLLSNSNWQFVTSVDYRGYLLFYEYLITNANKIQEFCQKVSLKECEDRYAEIRTSMRRIGDTDQTMAGFLGIENHRRRAKRSWTDVALKLAPYILEPFGKGLSGKLFGKTDTASLQMFSKEIAALQNGQQDIINSINMQATVFKVDSERQDMQIQWLQTTQGELTDKIKILEGTFAKDSEEKAREINELKEMLAETNEKIRMQEEVQKRLVEEVADITNQLKIVDDSINLINKEIDNIKDNITTLDFKVNLNTISINFNFLLNTFEIKQRELFEVVKKGRKGDLDPYVITPLNLIHMLVSVQSMLPEGMKFPLYPNIENAHNLYALIKPTIYLYNGTIIFMLPIPLVNSERFSILKMTSVPVPFSKNKFAFILPKQPYLLVDKNEEDYTLMSYQNFRDFCWGITKGISICEQVDQTSSVHGSNPQCEIQLFLNAKEIPNSCNKRLVSLEKPVFLQLQKQNSWIYAAPDSDTITFNCGSERKSVPIKATGFINMNNNCSARTPDFSLTYLAKFSRPVNLTYSPHLNLTDFIDISSAAGIESKDEHSNKQVFAAFDFDELKAISHEAKEVSDASMAATYYFAIIGGIIVVISLLLFLLFKKKLKRTV